MDLLLKKAKFTSEEIIIFKKKSNLIIPLENIKWLEYTKPSFWNYFFASAFFPGGNFPGYLTIQFKKKIGRWKGYHVRMKYEEFLKLPDPFKKIDLYVEEN